MVGAEVLRFLGVQHLRPLRDSLSLAPLVHRGMP
jgi:hypothetical protein